MQNALQYFGLSTGATSHTKPHGRCQRHRPSRRLLKKTKPNRSSTPPRRSSPAPSRNISPPPPRKAPGGSLRLHYDPASTTCRPILLFASENSIPLDYQLNDLFSDERTARNGTRGSIPIRLCLCWSMTASSSLKARPFSNTSLTSPKSPAYPESPGARERGDGFLQHLPDARLCVRSRLFARAGPLSPARRRPAAVHRPP